MIKTNYDTHNNNHRPADICGAYRINSRFRLNTMKKIHEPLIIAICLAILIYVLIFGKL